jgi:Fur family ferric uptake transcriptional regulator
MVVKGSTKTDIELTRTLIRKAGLRCTPARIAVLLELIRATSPKTHGEISDKLVPNGFDKATVFRNLSDLTEVGLVTRTELGDHVWRFEARDPSQPEKTHPHFICVSCGTVTCLGDMEFTTASRQRSASVFGKITEILIKGYCPTCQGA